MPKWTFLTNHAQVLLCLAQNRLITAREIGELVGITERSAQRILDDLETAGYIARQRVGRRNRYEIHPDLSMRHPAQQGIAIRHLLEILSGSRHSAAERPRKDQCSATKEQDHPSTDSGVE